LNTALISGASKATLRATRSPKLMMATAISFGALGLAFGPSLIASDKSALLLPAIIAVLFVQYYLSRIIGGAEATDNGSAGRWFGWSLVSAIPLLIIMGPVIFMTETAQDATWLDASVAGVSLLESLSFAVATAVSMPFLAVATGRAISGKGLPSGYIIKHCARQYVAIFIASFALLMAPNFLTDGLLVGFGQTGLSQASSWLFGILGGLVMLCSQALTIGISAQLYRNAEAEAAPQAVGEHLL
jgi:hypothetical protein